MRRWLALLCLLPALLHAEPIKVDIKKENGRIMLSAVFSVAVPRDVVWSVMTDYEHMPDFLPQMKSSKIVQKSGPNLRITQQGVVPVMFFDFSYESTRDIELLPPDEIRSHSVGGNTGPTRAVTHLQVRDQSTLVSYSATWTPASSMLASFGLDIMREQVSLQFSAMQQEMLRRFKNKPAVVAAQVP